MTDDDRYSLDDWRNADQRTVKSTTSPLAKRLLACIDNGEIITITYDGGNNPGSQREILPKRLFTVEGMDHHIYLDAHCYLREDIRCFRLDRLELTHEKIARPEKRTSKKKTKTSAKKRKTVKRRPVTSQSAAAEMPRAPDRKEESGVPTWVWWVGGIILLWILVSLNG